MALKPDGQPWTIREQIVRDRATGLTLQFETVSDDLQEPYRLRIFGDLPLGNREILFGRDGQRSGSGTALAGSCRPTWLVDLD